MDKLDLIIYETAHNSSYSLAELAEKMGVGQQVLINKVNYNNETNKLSLKEAVSMMQVTEDVSILKGLAWEFGYKLTPVDQTPEMSLLSAIVNVSADHGKVHQTIEAAFLDKKITPRELRQITEEINNAIEAYHTLQSTIEQNSDVK